MTTLDRIIAAGSRGISYDELVAQLEPHENASGMNVELLMLVQERRIERADGLYWARTPRDESNTPREGTVPVMKAPPKGGQPLGKPASDRPAVPMLQTAPPSGEPAAGAAGGIGSMGEKKRCRTCKQQKPIEEFYANGYCKPCGREQQRIRDAARRAASSKSASVPRAVSPALKPAAATPKPAAKSLPAAPPAEEPSPARTVHSALPFLLLPAQGRVAVGLEQSRDHGRVVQIASDEETVIEIVPVQMDAICEWWRAVRASMRGTD